MNQKELCMDRDPWSKFYDRFPFYGRRGQRVNWICVCLKCINSLIDETKVSFTAY